MFSIVYVHIVLMVSDYSFPFFILAGYGSNSIRSAVVGCVDALVI